MSQITLTGKFVNAAQPFTTGNFTKQVAIIEVTSANNYVSNYCVEFHNADVQNLFPQMQPHGMYQLTCWVQGTKEVYTDKNGQPIAYTSLKVSAVAPAGQQAQAPQQQYQQQFAQPAQQQFAQPAQGGHIGAPAPAQGFGQPAQPAQPAQNFGASTPQGFNS